MKENLVILLGIFGPLIAYASIGLSIYLSPSFNWYKNALSDLGHAQKSNVAPIFNSGLLISGFLITIYSVKSLINYAKYTSLSLIFSSLMLQAVAAFDEIYGRIHFAVSVLFFVSAGAACIIYFLEKKSTVAIVSFLVGLTSWLLYWTNVYEAGVAVPEFISAVAVTVCLIQSSLKMLKYEGDIKTSRENKM